MFWDDAKRFYREIEKKIIQIETTRHSRGKEVLAEYTRARGQTQCGCPMDQEPRGTTANQPDGVKR